MVALTAQRAAGVDQARPVVADSADSDAIVEMQRVAADVGPPRPAARSHPTTSISPTADASAGPGPDKVGLRFCGCDSASAAPSGRHAEVAEILDRAAAAQVRCLEARCGSTSAAPSSTKPPLTQCRSASRRNLQQGERMQVPFERAGIAARDA